MSDNSKNKNNMSSPKRFQPKILVIYLVILGVILALWNTQPNLGLSQKFYTVSELIDQIRSDDLVELEGVMKPNPSFGREGYTIEGSFRTEASLAEVIGDAEVDSNEFKFVAQGRLTEEDFLFLRSYFKEKQSSTVLQDVLVSFLPFILIVSLLYFLFVRQLKNAGKGAMSFGKSKAKMLTREKDSITFKDVAGCDEAKEEVGEVVDFLKDPKKFQTIGGKIPKGVLMVGPPGTGKTLLARAIAGEAGVPFFYSSGSEFEEMYVGVGASRVRKLFEAAKSKSPCIIFIDEIDAVGRHRGAGLGGGHDEREQTLNQLLVEMDGFEVNDGVIVMAATNRPDVLDPALLRPGRFDRQVVVGLPDIRGREQILKVHMRKVPIDDLVKPSVIARGTLVSPAQTWLTW